MSISSRSHSRVLAGRGDSAIRASEVQPKSFVDMLTTLVLPHESKTPRGAPPSRTMKRNIDQVRSGKDTTVQKFISFLFFRKHRGEPVEQVTAPLYLLAAAVAADEKDDIRELIALDKRAELESNLAVDRYNVAPTECNENLIAACEAVEQGISARLIACAARRELAS